MIPKIKNIDIYLLDQILKKRFEKGAIILDAGCGNGRNLKWFYQNDYQIYGIDADMSKIEDVKVLYPNQSAHFLVSRLESMTFQNNTFDHVICNAVLHFATSEVHFYQMFAKIFSVLKPKGMLFIRMTTNIGIENKVVKISNGVYQIPDGSTRFLLTKSILEKLQKDHQFTFLEPIKTVNVNDMRCMTTLVLQKE